MNPFTPDPLAWALTGATIALNTAALLLGILTIATIARGLYTLLDTINHRLRRTTTSHRAWRNTH
jgi:hypothetical protein